MWCIALVAAEAAAIDNNAGALVSIDDIQHRVAEAGGNALGMLSVSLSWSTPHDLDLRLHVPVLIREHHLLTKEICSDVVLYTDCDVVFSRVSAHAMMVEQSLLHGHVWSFSSEAKNTKTLRPPPNSLISQ